MKTLEFNPTQTKVKFIKEWTPEQFKMIENDIARHFRHRSDVECTAGQPGKNFYEFKSFAGADKILGLAYTSSGMWACYGVCNVSAKFDADGIYQYSYFTIGEDGNCYAVLQDNEENELVIQL